MNEVLSPLYLHKPIANIFSLEKLLGIDIKTVESIILFKDKFYRRNKPDEKGRVTYRVLEPLKSIQKAIHLKLLSSEISSRKTRGAIIYPFYLNGFLKERSTFKNALLHKKANTLITVDIKKYYDNCRKEIFFKIWKYFFNFNHEVASLLTELTTYHDFLPQGASTSPSLSNLVFWELEGKLVEKFKLNALDYGRYGDDVNISSQIFLKNDDKKSSVNDVSNMFSKVGLKINNKKKKITHSNKPMKVNNQLINREVSLGKQYSLNIRAGIHNLETTLLKGLITDEVFARFKNLKGRINYLSQYSLKRSKVFFKKLETLRITYCPDFSYF